MQVINIRNLIKITLIISLLLLPSCHQNYETYGFKSNENNFNWGVVGAKLIGNEKKQQNTIIESSPYELFLWFGSDTFMKGDIHIKNLKLVNAETKKVIFEHNNTLKEPIQKSTNNYRAYFSFKDIKIDYANVILNIRFLLEQGDKSTEYNTEIHFEKDYQKFSRMIGV